jgi:hypothetical protein
MRSSYPAPAPLLMHCLDDKKQTNVDARMRLSRAMMARSEPEF